MGAKSLERKKGFQRKYLKAFIIGGWLTMIRTYIDGVRVLFLKIHVTSHKTIKCTK